MVDRTRAAHSHHWFQSIAAAKTEDKGSSAQSGHGQKAFLPKPPPIPSRPLAPPRAPSRSLALPRAPSRSLARPSRPRRAPFAFPRAPSRSAKTCATVTKPPSGGYFTSFAAILAASRRQPPRLTAIRRARAGLDACGHSGHSAFGGCLTQYSFGFLP